MRVALAALLAVAAAFTLAEAAPLRALHGVPVPPGSRAQPDGTARSALGFRKTIDFYQTLCRRRGWTHELTPVTSHRGTTYARFLSTDRTTPWRAIHVYQHRSDTRIYVVPLDVSAPER